MTYAAFEETIEAGQPVEVYRFTAGTTSYFYTSAEDDVTVNLLDYVAIAIERGATSIGPAERETQFKISMPADDSFADAWKAGVPGVRVLVEVDRYQRNDGALETIRIFEGYVETVTFVKNLTVAEVNCRPSIGARQRVIPREGQHRPCNRVLYDGQCQVSNVDPSFRAASLTPSSQVGRVLTVPGLSGTYSDGWFAGGMVEVLGGTDYRLIIEHTGNDLTLLLPFTALPTTVNVLAGCDHSIETCKSKFDNVINFGGFAFVPLSNPFERGLV